MQITMKPGNVFDTANRILFVLASVLLILLMLTVCYQVVLRYFFGRATLGLMEITEYALLYITFLGAAWLLKTDGHVKLDLILNQFNLKTQAVINTFTAILSSIVWLIIAYYGFKVAWSYFQTGFFIPSPLEPLKWPIVAIIPAGSFMFSIQFLRKAYGHLKDQNR